MLSNQHIGVSKFIAFLMFIYAHACLTCSAQVTIAHWIGLYPVGITNSIPTNLFLTDNGFLFGFGRNGRVVRTKSIEEAKCTTECRPANEDPEGNWGQKTNGFQLSLRFNKKLFTNGEPIVAVMLMRNVADISEEYFRPPHIVVMHEGKKLKRIDENGIIQVSAPVTVTIYPQTQQKYKEQLNRNYDFKPDSEYYIQALCVYPNVCSQTVRLEISR